MNVPFAATSVALAIALGLVSILLGGGTKGRLCYRDENLS